MTEEAAQPVIDKNGDPDESIDSMMPSAIYALEFLTYREKSRRPAFLIEHLAR